MGMDSQAYLSSPDSYKERYPNSVKHELVHVIQLIMGVGINGTPAPDAWFTEGLAEYMSGGSVTPIESPESLETWLNNPQTVNPITVKTAEDLNGLILSPRFYYPVFGLAVEYLLESSELDNDVLEVKEMFEDMHVTRSFSESFRTHMGISLDYFHDNFDNLLREYITNRNSSN